MLSGRVKAIAGEIRMTLKDYDVPFGYVSVTCHAKRIDLQPGEEIRMKLVKAGEHRLPNGQYLGNFFYDYGDALRKKYNTDKLNIRLI